MKLLRSFVLFSLGLAVSLNLCQAQNNSFGTILGYVHDQSGRSISGATVQVKNTATGVVSTALTQPDGNYTVINLIPGPYVVSTEVTGFAKTVSAPTQLVVNQTLRIDLVLHPGAVSQTVTVTTQGALIDTDSDAVSAEISHQEVEDLPLSSGNFIDLAVLSPGVVSDPNSVIGGDQSGFRSNLAGGELYSGGNRGSSNAYMIDGVDDNDPGMQTLTITPPIEDIQDFRLMNKDYSAEYGGSAAQLNIATKSGTNEFHGTAYEYSENDAYDAVAEFAVKNPVTGAYKAVDRYNRFGAAAGGPILRNKLFFFTDYQGVRSHVVSNGLGIFPTAAEQAGDFSAECTAGFTNGVCNNIKQQLFEPGTVTPIKGNVITNYQPIDPTAAKMLKTGIFPATAPTSLPGINYIATLNTPDNINEYNIRVDAKLGQKDSLFARFSSSGESYAVAAVQPYGGSNATQAGKNIAVDYTHIFTSNFINDLHVGINRPVTSEVQDGGGGSDNITGSFFTGTSSDSIFWGAPYIYLSGYSTSGGPAVGPLYYVTTDAKVSDAVTWIHGAHTVQSGFYVGKVRYKETDSLISRGLLEDIAFYTDGFGTSAGDAFADLLLGDTFFAEEIQSNATAWYDSWDEAGYINDIYRLGTRVTLNLGVRYEYTAPMREEYNRGSIFDPTYPGGRLLTASTAGVAAANSPLVAYTPARDLTEPSKKDWSPRIGITFRPFANTVIRAGYGIYYDANEYNEYFFPALDSPFSTSYSAEDLTYFSKPVKLSSLFPTASPTPVAGTIGAYSLYRQSRTPYNEQWNFDVEHELPGNMMVEVGYVGTSASRIQDRREEDQGILSAPGGTVTKPYSNFVSILESENEASSNYNALIGRFEKRFSHGYSLLASYTYAKALGTESADADIGTENSEGYMNAWDKRADYGPLSYDLTQSLVFSPIWELPFGRGRMLASNAPGPINAVIGGWQAEGIFTAHTGFPFSVFATDESGTGSDSPRAEVIGNPFGPHAAGLAFNTAAFGNAPTHTFGNSGNNMMRGLGINNSDFSLIKTTTIHESLNFQLRFEAFNVFNQADIGWIPGDSTTVPSTFGQYLGIQHQPRSLELAGKINW